MTTTQKMVREAVVDAITAAGFEPVLDEDFGGKPGMVRVAAARGLRQVPLVWYSVDDTSVLLVVPMPHFFGRHGTALSNGQAYSLSYAPGAIEDFHADLADALVAVRAELDGEVSNG